MKAIVLGLLFGLLCPIIGLFIGLQVSPTLANILMLPVLLVSTIADVPFGMMGTGLRVISWLFSGFFWAAVFHAIAPILQRLRNSSR